jgi:hypothetical protein
VRIFEEKIKNPDGDDTIVYVDSVSPSDVVLASGRGSIVMHHLVSGQLSSVLEVASFKASQATMLLSGLAGQEYAFQDKRSPTFEMAMSQFLELNGNQKQEIASRMKITVWSGNNTPQKWEKFVLHVKGLKREQDFISEVARANATTTSEPV